MIIVEDDLLLSPDFLEYFEANAPVLERDSNTLVLSAWNDNGYRGRVSASPRSHNFCLAHGACVSRVFFPTYFGGGVMYLLSVLYSFWIIINDREVCTYIHYLLIDVYLARGSTGSWRGHVRFLVQLFQLRCDHK